MNINNIEYEKSFNVIGITIRTTNKEAINEETIQKLWKKFFIESIASKIPNKIDHAIIALYYDFENDYNGQYNLLIGARVSSIDDVPSEMVAQQVQAQKRDIFTSELGPVSYIVFELWKKIWILEDQNKLKRTYLADYELYDERSKDLQNARVSIHIGIK